MKYIIVERDGLKWPIIFPSIFDHIAMASTELVKGYRIVSAGFVINIDNEVRASGDSFSLGIKSRPEDSELIQEHLKRV
jgi:hypothetical protein